MDHTKCAEKVADHTGYHFRQCSRNRGYGAGKAYCRQHAQRHPDPEAQAKAARDRANELDNLQGELIEASTAAESALADLLLQFTVEGDNLYWPENGVSETVYNEARYAARKLAEKFEQIEHLRLQMEGVRS